MNVEPTYEHQPIDPYEDIVDGEVDGQLLALFNEKPWIRSESSIISRDCKTSETASYDRPLLRVGLTGLENLGNTCFMNSVIQCLSNTQELRDYFTEGFFKEDINRSNRLGSGGQVAVSFAVLLGHLWSGKHIYYSPAKLKSLLSEKFSQFSGFSQHDAQEYMSVLLDVLHEDINRIREKPNIQMNSKDGDSDNKISDEELANDSWHKFRMRNDSIIVDFFYGQFKSRVACPVCPKVSITFDPFLLLPVPMPKSKIIHTIYYFARDPSKKPTRHLVRLQSDSKIADLFFSISSKVNVNASCLRSMHVKEGTIQTMLKPHHSIPVVATNEMILVFECLNVENVQEPVYEFIVLQRLAIPRPSLNPRCVGCNKLPEEGRKLKRCTKCFRSSYCGRECQRMDWVQHKKLCTYAPEPVGCPFIISIPHSECTYSKIARIAYDYSKHSIDINYPQNQESHSTASSQIKDNDSMIYNDSTENSSYSWSSASSSVSSNSELSSPKFLLCHHPNHIDITISEDNIIKEPQNSENTILSGLASKYYISMNWNNKLGENIVIESKDLDHNYDILEAQKVSRCDVYTLEDCLKLFIEAELLSNMEAWYCTSCKTHREATKQLTIWRCPPILVIQLKRFFFKNLYYKEKINKFIKFPLSGLDMSPFMSPKYSKRGNQKPIYDLYAVINHYGGMLGGHYTAFARTRYKNEDLGWRIFDDNRVENLKEEEVVTESAYILFYRLRDEK